jgi:outer membrane protein assembly factor BamB
MQPHRALPLSAALVLAVALASAQDWPTYLHDGRRSGVSAGRTPGNPARRWTYVPAAPPTKAWGDPKPTPVEGIQELPRLRFDDAFHVAAADGLVFFGSSADHKVTALDAATGSVRWVFFTEGPVRNAPTVAAGNVYVGSDDGYAYCLNAADGVLRWRLRAGPADERVLGSGQMISRWPLRTGILVQDGIAYFGAGVFPAEGLFLYAADAATGAVVWKNDTYGGGGSADVSPQGYLLLAGDSVVVPSGRRAPMVFSRRDGRLLHTSAANRFAVGTFGGTFATLDGDIVYNGTEQMFGYRLSDGAVLLVEYARRLALSPERAYLLTGSDLLACQKSAWIEASRQRLPLHQRILQAAPLVAELEAQERRLQKENQPVSAQLRADLARSQALIAEARSGRDQLADRVRQAPNWRTPCAAVESLIVTADGVIAGGNGQVAAFAAGDGKPLWELPVAGRARGLALSEDRLLVSLDSGAIVCFAEGTAEARTVAATAAPLPPPPAATAPLLAAVETCLPPPRGYALVIGPQALPVSVRLAAVKGLRTYVASEDASQGDELRRDLDKLGLYGFQAAVLSTPDLAALPFSDDFANLVVWTAATPPPEPVAAELLRVLKPWGGALVVPAAAVARFSAGESPLQAGAATGGWAALTKGAVAGAGSWTHQYADAGNTACSADERVKGDLGVLWYGEPGPERIPNRHISSAAPLAADGRLFVEGENVLMCYDSANGVELWVRDLPGAARAGLKTACSNLVYADGSLFVVAAGTCHRLRADTGETSRTYALTPGDDGQPRTWGSYLSVAAGILLGSDQGQTLFALDAESGKPLWEYHGKAVDWITVAVSADRVFAVDRRATEEQQRKAMAGMEASQRLDRLGKPIPADVRVVVCLDLRSGRQLWESPQYVSDCIRVGTSGGELTLMAAKGVVLLCGQPWNGHFWQEFYAGDFTRRSLIALDATTGQMLWSGRKGYRSRPLIVGDVVIAEPWAHDLRTGVERQRLHPLTAVESDWQFSRPGHHCGNISACAGGLFFRSGSAAYYDLTGDYGTVHFGGQRPGCWINCIPANGVVLMPEASSGCICPYSLQCTTAFKGRRVPRSWGTYSAAGPTLPLRRLALNLGAPGDRRDEAGLLWLAYPRPGEGRLVLPLKLQQEFALNGGFVRGLDLAAADAAAQTWLQSCGARGLTRCRIPVLGDADGAALYSVRLHLRSAAEATPGACTLTISLQGQKVAEGLDLVAAAGGPGRVLVREFHEIRADSVLDLAVSGPAPSGTTPPQWIVTAVELTCDKVLHLGLAVPAVMLNNAVPEAAIEVRSANRTGSPFRGTLRATAPAGFAVAPAEVAVDLPPDGTLTAPFVLRLAQPGLAADVEARFALLRADGTVEFERKARIEYLADRGRQTVTASADAHVIAGTAGKSYGPTPTLAVDGGSTDMGDSAHTLAFLRFPIQLPGKPLSATLRLFVPESGHSQSADSGVIRLVDGTWDEATVTYGNMPKPGALVADLGKVDQGLWAERRLQVDLTGRQALDLVIVPRSCDGATYDSREGPNKPQLLIEYEALPAQK